MIVLMQKLKKFVTPILIATPLVWLLAQCSVGSLLPIAVGKKIWLNRNSAILNNEIRHIIPIGSSITSAKRLLEFNGFRCVYQKESSDTPDTMKTSKGDYISCNRTHSYVVCALTYSSTVYYIKDEVISIGADTGSYCM